MWTKKSFTLTELLVVIVIIGILAALGMPTYSAIKEKTLDREAKASLALIQAAEKIYKMETTFYYPYSGSESNVDNINNNLKLSLPNPVSWSYTVDGAAPNMTATRAVGDKVWELDFPDSVPVCTGADCP